MADPPHSQDPHDDTGSDRDGRRTGVAPWQVVVGVIGLLVVLGIVVLLLLGDHGPGRHAPAGSTGQPPAADEFDHDELDELDEDELEEFFEDVHG